MVDVLSSKRKYLYFAKSFYTEIEIIDQSYLGPGKTEIGYGLMPTNIRLNSAMPTSKRMHVA